MRDNIVCAAAASNATAAGVSPTRQYADIRRSKSLGTRCLGNCAHTQPGVNSAASLYKAVILPWHTTALPGTLIMAVVHCSVDPS